MQDGWQNSEATVTLPECTQLDADARSILPIAPASGWNSGEFVLQCIQELHICEARLA